MYNPTDYVFPIVLPRLRAKAAGRALARLDGIACLSLALLGLIFLAGPALAQSKSETPLPAKTGTSVPASVPSAFEPVETPPSVPDKRTDKNADIAIENAHLEVGTSCVAMRLTNKGKTLDALLKAETPVGKAVMISQTMHQDVPRIEIYPEKPTTLQLGLMCIIVRGVKTPFKAGDSFDLTLTFEKAPAKKVRVSVVTAEQVPSYKPENAEPPAKQEAVKHKENAKEGAAKSPEKQNEKETEKKPDVKATEEKASEEKKPEVKAPEEKKPEEKKEDKKTEAPTAPASTTSTPASPASASPITGDKP